MLSKSRPLKPYEQAMSFIATYDRSDNDEYEKHVARIARQWLTIQRPNQATQRIVDRLLDELAQPPPLEYGCGWNDLRTKFTAWAKAEGWMDKKKGNSMRRTTFARFACLFCLIAPCVASAGMEVGVIHDIGLETRYRAEFGSRGTGTFDVKR